METENLSRASLNEDNWPDLLASNEKLLTGDTIEGGLWLQ